MVREAGEGREPRGIGSGKGQSRASPFDLSAHIDQEVQVKLAGGRQLRGVLKGWDQLINIVLDDTVEELRDPDDPYLSSGRTRNLGLVVARGTSVMTISPLGGVEEIENPFNQPDTSLPLDPH